MRIFLRRFFPKPGYVYLIGCKSLGAIKIGYSKHPHKRLKELQTASPYLLEMLGLIEGTFKTESHIQRRFKEHHMDREWFYDKEEIREYFKGNVPKRIHIWKVCLSIMKFVWKAWNYASRL